jgi:hypothetical protein
MFNLNMLTTHVHPLFKKPKFQAVRFKIHTLFLIGSKKHIEFVL